MIMVAMPGQHMSMMAMVVMPSQCMGMGMVAEEVMAVMA
jgi:hypothetical protein